MDKPHFYRDKQDNTRIYFMVKITNKEARVYVKDLLPFQASNLSGEWIGKAYVVSSYVWYPVFVHKDGKWYENYSTYTRTTARHMSTVRPDKVDEYKHTLDLNNLIKD